jgi:hypothetical protein
MVSNTELTPSSQEASPTTLKDTHASGAPAEHGVPPTQQVAEPVATPIAPHQDVSAKAALGDTATQTTEKLTGKKVGGLNIDDVAPAILKEDAITKKPTVDGHEAVVTKQGVGKCSPSPCPVIHVMYAQELAEFPALKEWNDRIQALRNTDPTRAADEAERLIRMLEVARSNAAPRAAIELPEGDDRSFELHIGKKRAEQIRLGEKNFIVDRALTFDIDEVLPVGAPDIKPQRAVDRARSAYNRQLLDPNTNQRTKGLGVDVRELRRNRSEYDPVSVRDDPNALLNRRFSEVYELKRIFDQAVASVKEPQKLTPTELKASINKETRRIITESDDPDAVNVRKALAKLGFEHQPGRGFTMMREPSL